MICRANQLTGFYLMGTLVIKRLTNYKHLKKVNHYFQQSFPRTTENITGKFFQAFLSVCFSFVLILTHFMLLISFPQFSDLFWGTERKSSAWNGLGTLRYQKHETNTNFFLLDFEMCLEMKGGNNI